jgi:hypothetical protein
MLILYSSTSQILHKMAFMANHQQPLIQNNLENYRNLKGTGTYTYMYMHVYGSKYNKPEIKKFRGIYNWTGRSYPLRFFLFYKFWYWFFFKNGGNFSRYLHHVGQSHANDIQKSLKQEKLITPIPRKCIFKLSVRYRTVGNTGALHTVPWVPLIGFQRFGNLVIFQV